MDGMIIIVLVCLQLVSFSFIVILFAKLNKFKELERKQQQVVEEMDAALAAYLMEMKEENDRLIKQLATVPKPEKEIETALKVKPSIPPKVQVPIQPVSNAVSQLAASNVYKANIEKQTQLEESAMLTPNSTVAETKDADVKLAEQVLVEQSAELQVKELSFEEMVIEMYKDGKSIEEIAKNLDKGKTEIELLIKFHT